MTGDELRDLIVQSLQHQGFLVQGSRIHPPVNADQGEKEKLRELHFPAVQHRVERAREGLRRHQDRLLRRLAEGSEVVPEKIIPRLVEVQAGTVEELLFRYAALHWSIPVSSGYGRRLRFLVIDEQNEKLIGLFGLGDPVFGLAARDRWVGWDAEARRQRLHNVMDAFVLGAVPPYSFLLCGKLVSMLAASNEVREAFARKYTHRTTFIRARSQDGRLAMLTTASALGRSSIYNRLKYRERLLYHGVGFTRGSGEFHFSNGLYKAITEYALKHCTPTAKREGWGTGFRNRREIIKKCLANVGLPQNYLYNGIRREIFVVPLGRNTREFLRGEDAELDCYDQPARDLFAWFRERWLLPRAAWDQRFREFDPSSWRLWEGKGGGG